MIVIRNIKISVTILLQPVLIFFAVFAVYAASTVPSVTSWDSAELTLGVYTQGILHAPGYPLYLLLARAFTFLLPGLDFAWRVNLFSALMGAVTALLLCRLCLWLAPRAPGVCAGMTLLYAFAPRIWGQAVRAEVYTLHTALTAGALLLFLHWRAQPSQPRLLMLALLTGLMMGHHPAGVLVGGVLLPAVWVARPRKAPPTGFMALVLLVMALPYAYLPLRAAADPGFNLLDGYFSRDLTRPADWLWFVSGGMFASRLFAYGPLAWAGEVGRFVAEWGRQFLYLGLLVGGVGVGVMWQARRGVALLLLLIFGVQVIFFSAYNVFDKWAMFHTAYLVWTPFAAVGAVALRERLPSRWLALVLGTLVLVQLGVSFSAGAWNDRRYARQAAAVLAALPPDALLVGPWTAIRPVEVLQQIDGLRPDVTTLDYSLLALGIQDETGLPTEGAAFQGAVAAELRARIDAAARPVYVIEPPDALRAVYPLELAAPGLYRLGPP